MLLNKIIVVTIMKNIVLALEKKRQELNLSDRLFSKKLNVSLIYWGTIKRRQRNIGIKLLQAVARTFPDMDKYIWAYRRGEELQKEFPSVDTKEIPRFRGWDGLS
jgi:hypothetical protein